MGGIRRNTPLYVGKKVGIMSEKQRAKWTKRFGTGA